MQLRLPLLQLPLKLNAAVRIGQTTRLKDRCVRVQLQVHPQAVLVSALFSSGVAVVRDVAGICRDDDVLGKDGRKFCF